MPVDVTAFLFLENWMKISISYLQENWACDQFIDWYRQNRIEDPVILIKTLITNSRRKKVMFIHGEDSLVWANWVMARILDVKQRIDYSFFAAWLAIDIFEQKHPEDKRPRQVLESAKDHIDYQRYGKKVSAAYLIAYDGYSGAYDSFFTDSNDPVTYSAYGVAYATAAVCEADEFEDAVRVVDDLYFLASANTYFRDDNSKSRFVSAVVDHGADYKKKRYLQIKILNHGLKLLRGE